MLKTEESKADIEPEVNVSSEGIKKIDDDLYQYVKDILEMICTDDKKVNEENMELIIDQISSILKN